MIKINFDLLLTVAWCVFAITIPIIRIQSNTVRIVLLILLIVLSRKKMKLGPMQIFCLFFCAYYFLDSVFVEGIIDSLNSTISMLSWIITVLVLTSYSKTEKELNCIFNFIIISSVIVSIVLFVYNPLFSDAVAIRFNGDFYLNRNLIIYYIFPGYLFQLIKLEKNHNPRFIDYALYGVLLLSCLQINSRAMYFSLLISTFLIFYKKMVSMIKQKKIFGLVMLFVLSGIAIKYVFMILPESYITREFGNSVYQSDSGRSDLWIEAIGFVKNPLFGMGPSYYSKNAPYIFATYGAHNIFVDLYVSTGIFSSILFAIFTCFFIKKNIYILAIIAPAFISFVVEAGRTFFPYMLLIMAWYIYTGSKNQNITIDDYLSKIFNDNNEKNVI